MWYTRESKIPSAAEALPGRTEPIPVPPATSCSARPWWAPSQANSRSSSAWAASGARKSSSGRSPACSRRPWATRRTHAEPHLPRGLLGTDGPYRGCAGRVRPASRQPRGTVEGVLGSARSHAGHAAGQRHRDAISLSCLCRAAPTNLRHVEESRAAFQQALKAAGFGAITTETRLAPPFYYAEEYTSSTSPRIPTAIADSAAPAFRATRNSGCGVRNEFQFERFEVRRN